MPTTDRVLENFADGTRREIVAVLRERSSPVPVDELAAALAARRDGSPDADVAEADRAAVAADLAHVHLPALADADLVEWRSDDGSVTATDHPAHDDERVQAMLSTDTGADDWDAVIRRLADARRRHIVSILEDGDGTVGRRALARRVAAREVDDGTADVSESTVDAVEASLYHTHIPALRRAGLVEDDGETVRYDGHPDFDPAWLSIDLDGADGAGSGPRNVDGARATDDSGTSIEPPQTTVDEADD